MYFVYALFNKEHKKLYVGQTIDLQQRLELHASKVFQTSFTARFSGEWMLIYTEETVDRKEALKRERQLKSFRGREFLKQHIPR